MCMLSDIYYNNYKKSNIKIISNNMFQTYDGADNYGPESELNYFFFFYKNDNNFVIDVWYNEHWYGHNYKTKPELVNKFEYSSIQELVEQFLKIYNYTTFNYSKTKGWLNKIKQKYK